MKKILGIIVLGLLLSGNAYAEECSKGNCDNGKGTYIFSDGGIYSGQWKNGRQHGTGEAFLASGATYDGEWKNGFIHGNGIYKWPRGSDEYFEYTGGFYEHKKHGEGILTRDNGKSYSVVFVYDDLKQEELVVVKEKENKLKLSSNVNSNDKLTQSKQICNDLGFQPKTEKHADCAMKMMLIQFETTNKVASASGGTTQEVVVTHRNDYDIWDALLDFSAAIDPKNKTTTSSSSSNRGTNCVVGRTNPTFGTTTINCN